MPVLLRLALLALLLLPALAGCDDPVAPRLQILEPAANRAVNECSVEVEFELAGAQREAPRLLLNQQPLDVPIQEGPPGTFRASLGPDSGLQASNLLRVHARPANGPASLTDDVWFGYTPPVRAYRITGEDQLITGPLAHNRIGDYMLESCVAKFAIQDGGQRDLYSVGQFGGNIIDAARIGRPGLDNFLEFQPMANVETVINAQDVFIVNDGADGAPAVIRACGPDDLLDFVNPSSQVSDLGIPFPPELNDNDQTVEGCSEYTLAQAFDSHIRIDTTFTNIGGETIEMLSGDWMNQGGELDVMQTPNPGVGAALFNEVGAMSFHGVGEAGGVDYAYTSTPPGDAAGSYVVISGVTVVLHSNNVLLALLGAESGVEVAPGGSHVMTRYFGVGEGSGSSAVDLELAIKGLDKARIQGCVSVAGVPAPDAKVTVGVFDDEDDLTALATAFVTDLSGCYAGDLPVDGALVSYGVIAGRKGTPYQGGGSKPEVTRVDVSPGDTVTVDIDLPETGALEVTATTPSGDPLPVRVSVVGFDPSPDQLIQGLTLPGFGTSVLALLDDPGDRLPFGLVHAVHTEDDGVASFALEPGSYRVVVSRGTEYSISDHPVTITAGSTTSIDAVIAQVLDTSGFVSSDFHVHGINSADSRVSDTDRILGYAGEGVDNIVMTDHHVHTDLEPGIDALGMSEWISSTIGEEITTFDYGHFNGYPFSVDPTRISGGSTDWAGAAPPGQDFPSAGAYNAAPADIFALATTGAASTPDTTVQINHIDSHFAPLQIDTSLVPPRDDLDDAERLERRLGEPTSTNLFFAFPALELWNGNTRGAQREFLEDRIGIWFNLLNQGIETTFVADTDSHRHTNLRMAGARSWTAAAPGSDAPGSVDPGEVANMVDAGKLTGGQGIFVTTRLRATDGSGDSADLTHSGSTHMTDAAGDVELDIRVQAPLWAPFDVIEIYANASTTPVDPEKPYLYSATPSRTLDEGDCDATTTGDGDFDISVIPVAAAAGASRYEANLTVQFDGLSEDSWFVVLARATDGECAAMFPVFASDLDSRSNASPGDLMDGNVGEGGVLALGVTNALYFDAPGE